MGSSTFKGCAALKDAAIGGLARMGSSAFEKCSSMASVSISGSLNALPASAFAVTDAIAPGVASRALTLLAVLKAP